MRDLLFYGVGRWFRQSSVVLIVAVSAAAGCHGDDASTTPSDVDAAVDAGAFPDALNDRAIDATSDRRDAIAIASDRASPIDTGRADTGESAPDVAAEASGQADSSPVQDATVDAPEPVCTDHVKNGTETDVDCGGTCAPMTKCADGKGCRVAGDCVSGVCPSSNICAVPVCSDGVKNGTETDVDCGGSCAPSEKCGNGRACAVNGDCQTNICKTGVCVLPTCTNGVKDATETAVDCGGPDCGPCDDADACLLNRDCKDGKCTNLVCTAPSCTDLVKNGTETDVDCGGPCSPCALTKLCSADTDCVSGHCPSGTCVECLVASSCAGQDTECQTRSCTAHACGFSLVAPNTAITVQVPGDCHTKRCDGAGGIVDTVDDVDVPVDNNQCTDNVCTAGTPSNPFSEVRTRCTQNNGALCTGNGLCVACIAASDCPGVDNECQTRTCNSNTCGFSYAAVGTATTAQIAGDCHTIQCNGALGTTNAVNDSDLPVDGNPCTGDLCTAGVPSNPPVTIGTSCGIGMFCNSMGECSLMCAAPTDCPGTENDCQTRTCISGLCGFNRQPAGTVTPIGTQTAGDCHTEQCDNAGNIVNVVDDADVPIDTNACTDNLCSGGVPSNPPLSGTTCSQMGGRICSSANDATCVECNAATDCPGSDTECHSRTCTAHVCGIANTADGTPVTAGQTANDCQQLVCSSGNIVTQDDTSDVPADDNNPCTAEVCAGSPSAPIHDQAANAGFVCAGPQGGRCNSSGACVPTFVVLRVGDGAAPLTNASTAGFVERRYFDSTGALVPVPVVTGVLALPTAVNGAQQPISFSGSASSEGLLSLSSDLRYLTIAGYGAAPGMGAMGTAVCTVGTTGCTGAISATSTVNLHRVVARVDAAGNIDTSTQLNAAFSANNVRGATSIDGTGFWVTGAGGATAGVQFIGFNTVGGAQVETAPASTRAVLIAAGQLYASSNSNPNANVFTVGSGTPQTAGQLATSLNGLSTANGPSPYQFLLLDRDANVPGVDTLYVADDRAVAAGGGIQKYTFDGTTWTLAATFTDSLVATAGVRGLTGMVTGTTVTLLATTADATNANKVVMYVDDGTANPPQVAIATAAVNTVYRGLALAP